MKFKKIMFSAILLAVTSSSFALPVLKVVGSKGETCPDTDICVYVETQITDSTKQTQYNIKGRATVIADSKTIPLPLSTGFDESAIPMEWFGLTPEPSTTITSFTLTVTNFTIDGVDTTLNSSCKDLHNLPTQAPNSVTLTMQGDKSGLNCSYSQ